MTYYADPSSDLPAAWKQKRVVIYAQGLKIYGQIPYILQRRLKAEFYSNHSVGHSLSIIAPTMESNYTVVQWKRGDGNCHSPKILESLIDWLYEGKGFTIGIATREFFYDRLDGPNVFQIPPTTFVPGGERWRGIFRKALASGKCDVGSLEA